MKKKISVAIVGASGFTGGEICRILLNHNNIKRIYPISRDKNNFIKKHPNLISSNLNFSNINFLLNNLSKIDCIFLCTKSTESFELAKELLKKNKKIIDLSSAFRFEKNENFKKAYGYDISKRKILKNKIEYGLSEFNKPSIKKADLIANPGCYAITALYSLAPIINKNFIDTKSPIGIFAINGTTGAGNNPKIEVSHANATENVLTYNADGHRHGPEIEDKIQKFFKKKVFIDLNTAHGNFRRGIYLRINLNLKKNFRNKINREKIINIFKKYYNDRKKFKFIHILDFKKLLKKNEKEYDIYPSVNSVVGSNNCIIGIDYDDALGSIKIISTTDNLIKGAAGSAIQNMNIMFKFKEEEALSKYGIF